MARPDPARKSPLFDRLKPFIFEWREAYPRGKASAAQNAAADKLSAAIGQFEDVVAATGVKAEAATKHLPEQRAVLMASLEQEQRNADVLVGRVSEIVKTAQALQAELKVVSRGALDFVGKSELTQEERDLQIAQAQAELDKTDEILSKMTNVSRELEQLGIAFENGRQARAQLIQQITDFNKSVAVEGTISDVTGRVEVKKDTIAAAAVEAQERRVEAYRQLEQVFNEVKKDFKDAKFSKDVADAMVKFGRETTREYDDSRVLDYQIPDSKVAAFNETVSRVEANLQHNKPAMVEVKNKLQAQRAAAEVRFIELQGQSAAAARQAMADIRQATQAERVLEAKQKAAASMPAEPVKPVKVVKQPESEKPSNIASEPEHSKQAEPHASQMQPVPQKPVITTVITQQSQSLIERFRAWVHSEGGNFLARIIKAIFRPTVNKPSGSVAGNLETKDSKADDNIAHDEALAMKDILKSAHTAAHADIAAKQKSTSQSAPSATQSSSVMAPIAPGTGSTNDSLSIDSKIGKGP